MPDIALWISGIGLILVFSGALGNIFFKMGQHSARLDKVESDSVKMSMIENHAIRLTTLELWRADVRKDMHEISDKMTQMITEIHGVKTLIEERTERRKFETSGNSVQSDWQEKRRQDQNRNKQER